MKRFHIDEDFCEVEADDGTYYKVEDVEPIIADRDIKAANLKLLVDGLLGYDETVTRAVDSGGDGGDVFEAEETYKGLIELARGLKQ